MMNLARGTIAAIVPAAGSSTRLNIGVPKPLIKLCGKTVIEWTVSTLRKCPSIGKILVMVPAGQNEAFAFLTQTYENLEILIGGDSRRESVNLGLKHLSAESDPECLVLIHDAARCLVTSQLIEKCVLEAIDCRAVTAAIPMVDTIKEVNSNKKIIRSLKRDSLFSIQTPQVFELSLLIKAHNLVMESVTDDSALVESIHEVKIVIGDSENLKVTTPIDLEVAKVILSKRNN